MSERKKLILIGGGGHCKSVIDVVNSTGDYYIHGILDISEKKGVTILGNKIIGTDINIADFVEQGFAFHVSLGQVKAADSRKRIYEILIGLNADMPVICSPNAYLSSDSHVGRGSIIMHQVLVNAGAQIGSNCIINNKALIEHDSVIGNHCHISTAAVINGDCVVGNECLIGSNSVLLQGTKISDKCLVGAGSVVTKEIVDANIYAGNPARVMKK